MKFFFPIRTGTLQRERTRIAAKRGRHLRRVMQLDAQIAALQNERNEHFAAASAYVDAENTLDLQSGAMIDIERNVEMAALTLEAAR